jgi:phosphoribosylaminoimidazole-succinocarboxamide synthase
VVRGYLAGSGWKDYRETGTICGVLLPTGLSNAERLPDPIFTPATKAAAGSHDENIDFDAMAAAIGGELADRVRSISLALYARASAYAAKRGILIADTKFEFGLAPDGTLTLMDEVLTADSSRFWPAASYEAALAAGANPPSFDKQYLRDYLESVPGWDKRAPAPPLPDAVVAETAAKYREALRLLTQ